MNKQKELVDGNVKNEHVNRSNIYFSCIQHSVSISISLFLTCYIISQTHKSKSKLTTPWLKMKKTKKQQHTLHNIEN